MNIAETSRKDLQRLFIRGQQAQRFRQKIVEIQRVVHFEVAAIQTVDVADVADPLDVGILCAVFFGSQPEHFRVGDVPFHVFQEFFVVVFALLKGFFDDGGALCFAVNGKIFIIAQTVGEHAQDPHAHASALSIIKDNRCCISLAALFVKVIAKTEEGYTPFSSTM